MAAERVSRSHGSWKARAVPMRALFDRARFSTEMPKWSRYLPEAFLQVNSIDFGAVASNQGGLATGREGFPVHYTTDELPTFDECTDVAGKVWNLSQDAAGCRYVQKTLENADSNEEREAIANELRGHVLEASRCPSANHVLQKCVISLSSVSVQFIIDELVAGNVSQIARHKYGCRIIQRLVEHCPTQMLDEMARKILIDVSNMSRHTYGNYVIQALLQFGFDDHRCRIVKALTKNTRGLSSEAYGCAVLSSALSYGPLHLRRCLAQAVLREPGLLVSMSNTRQGHTAALRVLGLLEGDEQKDALQRLKAESDTLKMSKYGRVVVSSLANFEDCWVEVACRAGA